ncbi:hypothetical protein V6Z11_D01G132900 [Gossypium hirsutum]
MGVKVCMRGPSITHLLFVDDNMIFGEASDEGCQIVQSLLQRYERCSKLQIFFNSNVLNNTYCQITSQIVVKQVFNPKSYLELSIMVKRRKNVTFQHLKDRLKEKISHWSVRMLSRGGKEIFIKSVLQELSTYLMSCSLLLKFLCNELEGIISRFWWQKEHNQKGILWCKWKDLCALKEEGGLSSRDFSKFNIVLLAK